MWGFLKRNASFAWLGVVLCFLGAILLSMSGETPQSDLELFGQSGKRNFSPPESYKVSGTESVFEIADRLKVPFYDLIIENRLTGELPLAAGSLMRVPRYDQAAGKNPGTPVSSPLGRGVPVIRADRVSGTSPLVVQLRSDADLSRPGARFVWDLGNNRFSFESSPRVTYTHPGIYQARLAAVDTTGHYVLSDPVRIAVADVRTEYKGLPFISLDRVGDFLSTTERVYSHGRPVIFDEETVIIQNPPLLKYLRPDTFISVAGGFSRVELRKGSESWSLYLFVSPFPARMSAEPEYDWYKTQFDTGMYGNCGPAANASAIKWAMGDDFAVPDIRGEIGMPFENGAVDYFSLRDNLIDHSVEAEILPINGPKDVMSVIDSGGVAIVSFNCGSLTPTEGDKRTDYVGRYYPDETGHYLLIKGYTLDKDKFIVYDAIPGDWRMNEARYADGVSMIGRNRFFKVDEVLRTVSRLGMIAVWRKPL